MIKNIQKKPTTPLFTRIVGYIFFKKKWYPLRIFTQDGYNLVGNG